MMPRTALGLSERDCQKPTTKGLRHHLLPLEEHLEEPARQVAESLNRQC